MSTEQTRAQELADEVDEVAKTYPDMAEVSAELRRLDADNESLREQLAARVPDGSLHAAVCDAVSLMNQSTAACRYMTKAHDTLRNALIAYADASAQQPGQRSRAMSQVLSDDEIMAIGRELGKQCRLGGNLNIDFDYARAIESAILEKLADRLKDAERVAELLANEKVLLAQIQGHTEWRERIIKASEQAYGKSAIRYKFSLTKSGKCMNTFPREIDGRWFALVPAEDDGHIGHIARIAELEIQLRAAIDAQKDQPCN